MSRRARESAGHADDGDTALGFHGPAHLTPALPVARCARRSAAARPRARSSAEMMRRLARAVAVDLRGDRLDIRVLEQIDGGQHRAESLDDSRVHSDEVQGGRAQVEEIVVNPDCVVPENARQDVAKLALRGAPAALGSASGGGSGAGSRLDSWPRSTLPLGDSGNASSTVIEAGTMKSGNRCAQRAAERAGIEVSQASRTQPWSAGRRNQHGR